MHAQLCNLITLDEKKLVIILQSCEKAQDSDIDLNH